MTHDSDQNGLALFDETASAVRGFPNAMLGYDKRAVDEYIRDVERQLSLAKHQLREVQRELTAANLRVDLLAEFVDARAVLQRAVPRRRAVREHEFREPRAA